MVETFDKNMRASGLPDKVKKCIENGEFKMKNAMKVLALLGDDEESVDVDKLIAIARKLELLEKHPRRSMISDEF